MLENNNTNSKKKFVIRSWMGVFGLAGLSGFLAFSKIGNSSDVVFFGFFGFFAFYWEGKIVKEKEDERLIANRLKAQKIAATTGFVLTWFFALMTANVVSKWRNWSFEFGYMLLLMIISIGFAVSMLLSSYLAYHFDRGED